MSGERVSLAFLNGPQSGATVPLPRLPATLGSEADVDVVIPGVAPRHCLLFRRDRDVVVLDSGSGLGTYLGEEAVQEAVLRDGDVLELGRGGPRLRFRREGRDHRAATAPLFRGRVSELSAIRLLLRTSGAFRWALALLLLAGLGLVAWGWRESRHMQGEIASLRRAVHLAEEDRRVFQERVNVERARSEAERRTLEKRIEEFRAREDELNRELAAAATGQVDALRGELDATRGRIKTLESERAAGETIIKQYGAGVCLLQGSYAFYDATNRPLRVKLSETGRAEREADGSLSLDPEGTGPVHDVDYYGTGFLVDRRGLILTNRHVAEPWWNDDSALAMERAGYKPRLLMLRAFFPSLREAVSVVLERRSETIDLALLRADLRGKRVPALPLERSKAGTVAGQPVVVVGYPAGLEAILAKADSNLVKEILASHGTDSGRVTEALSVRGLIRPSTTQGHIGDVTKTDIVFDAPTTQGGSGGPVFNKNGQVIAVEYAVLPKFGGNSFGIPISYAVELLEGTRKRPGA